MSEQDARSLNAPQCKPFLFSGDEHGVLLIHGYTGSAAHMRCVGEHLRGAGFTVLGINLPGHATILEDMRTKTWRDWKRAAEGGLKLLRGKCSSVSVAGLSMGGDLALILAEENPDLTVCCPIAAPMSVQNKAIGMAGILSIFKPYIHSRVDPHRADWLDPYYDRGYGGQPTAKAMDLLHLIHLAKKDLHKVTCPTLIVQSRADRTIGPESADTILSGISARKKEIMWLEDVPHACTASPRHAAMIAERLSAWILHGAEG